MSINIFPVSVIHTAPADELPEALAFAIPVPNGRPTTDNVLFGVVVPMATKWTSALCRNCPFVFYPRCLVP